METPPLRAQGTLSEAEWMKNTKQTRPFKHSGRWTYDLTEAMVAGTGSAQVFTRWGARAERRNVQKPPPQTQKLWFS